jgi:hypothetical protein
MDDPEAFERSESPADGFAGKRRQPRPELEMYLIHAGRIAGVREFAKHRRPLAGQFEPRLPADVAQQLDHVARCRVSRPAHAPIASCKARLRS